ncbi:MAG: 50S ribosomal protein L17 [Acidobacteria bacterium]|jgi:large subunit ribosomal protein L17|nr:MAG: 50S ribosomal protein L17 [Acidobacteriota bacterium]GIU82103.1 MAG: 50S ribosomal protein L17 [Pyrinomonadaceae bacterium]
MRHLKAHRKLGRKTEHRISMLRNLATSLVNSEKEYIITTVPKAKELRSFIEKAITLARKAQFLTGEDAKAKEVHLRRLAAKFFHSGNRNYKKQLSVYAKGGQKPERTAGVRALQRLFSELGPRYKDRNGGYTRIIRLGKRRKGDGAELAIIELVDNPREIQYKESAKQSN